MVGADEKKQGWKSRTCYPQMSKAIYSSSSGASNWSILHFKLLSSLMKVADRNNDDSPNDHPPRVERSKISLRFLSTRRGNGSRLFILYPHLMGHSRALYLTTTGSTHLASSPQFGDLFHELLPSPQEVLPRALDLAEHIVAQTLMVSTYLMRQMLWRHPGLVEGVYLLDSELMWESHDNEDKNGRFKAFLEKRSPIMKGNLKDGMPRNMSWREGIDTRLKSGDRDENRLRAEKICN
jgi:hypothetical protein